MTEDVSVRQANNLARAITQAAWMLYGHGFCGEYCLIIHGDPEIPNPKSTDGKRLLESATQFIDLTAKASNQIADQLLSDENGTISIERREWSGSSVTVEFRREILDD